MSEGASTPDAEDAVVELVRARDHVSFVEIARCLAAFMDVKGSTDLLMPIPGRGEVVLWVGMSQTFADLINKVSFVDKRIRPEPASWMVYLIDGGLLRLPLMKRKPPRGGFKKPHWLPVCFRINQP